MCGAGPGGLGGYRWLGSAENSGKTVPKLSSQTAFRHPGFRHFSGSLGHRLSPRPSVLQSQVSVAGGSHAPFSWGAFPGTPGAPFRESVLQAQISNREEPSRAEHDSDFHGWKSELAARVRKMEPAGAGVVARGPQPSNPLRKSEFSALVGPSIVAL